ncbi:MAG: response regulator [Pseudomonadota bacterium]
MARVTLIALVEDDLALRDALADLLEVSDYPCRTFEGSESFLAAHAPGRFDCLITDLNLIGASGLQLLERLKTLEPALPVIVISAQTDPSVRRRVLQAGALAYLTKPLNDQVLLRHLAAALGRGAPAA